MIFCGKTNESNYFSELFTIRGSQNGYHTLFCKQGVTKVIQLALKIDAFRNVFIKV